MRKVLFWFMVANAISMLVQLGIYAWGSHSPSSLAIGILNGFVMLLLAQTVLAERENS